MKTLYKRSIFALVGLASLLLALGFLTLPRAHAAEGDCPLYDYAWSNNANVVSNGNPQMFGYQGSNAPQLGLTFDPCSDHITFEWSNQGADFYQLITSINGGWSQVSISGNLQTDPSTGNIVYTPNTSYAYSTFYSFKVQSCNYDWWWSDCSDWSPDVNVYTDPQGICIQGYVWRQAIASDHVCVTPQERDQVAYDNSQAPYRVDPNGGPYGPDTCLQGFVWRQAFSGDYVCVTLDQRSQAAYDNSQAPYRIV